MRPLTALLTAAAILVVITPLLAAEDATAEATTDEAPEPQARVLIRSDDLLRGTGLAITPEHVRIETPYSGTVTIDRSALAGIAFTTGHDREILEASAEELRAPGERDALHLMTGDKISGEIVETDGQDLLIKTVYGGGKATRIPLKGIEYISVSAGAGFDERDPVRVVFVNGDVVGGTLVGFKDGTFRLDTQYAGTLRFTTDDMQSLHNVAKSRQFFPGGLAEAFMRLFEQSSEMRRQYMNILPTLVRGFLSQGDVESALYIFHRMSGYNLDWYNLARAFEEAKQPDAALQCYERMYAQRRHSPYVFRQLFQAYVKYGRHAKAAEVYEELLKQPPGDLANSGITESQVRMALAGVYAKLDEHDKAVVHLRKVLDDPAAEADTRHDARTALVESFKKIGQLDDLVTKYITEMAALDEQLGADYVALVEKYIERGKLTKARKELTRLEYLGLDTYAARARTLLDEAGGDQPDDDDEPDTDDDDGPSDTSDDAPDTDDAPESED